MTVSRRSLFQSVAGLCLPAWASAQMTAAKPAVHIRVTPTALATMPADFAGLSYESAQLYNANYFSARNAALVRAFAGLSASGVLRLGGNLSDLARWQSPVGDFATPRQTMALEHLKSAWEWKLTDPVASANRGGAITPQAIRNLREFLDATGWRAIYGLNFGSGSAARARDEAAHVANILGPRLIAFQIGNEADFYGGNPLFRDRGFDFEAYYAGYRAFASAVREGAPAARFGGPDTAVNMQWTDLFARAESPDTRFLSSHHYTMGPAGDRRMTAELLLAPDAPLRKQIRDARAAMRDGGVPFRLTEANSCYLGGQPGVSDTFAAALWVADMMLETAQSGYAGVNLHGGGSGFYTPIASDAENIAEVRPLYFGMRFAQTLARAEFLQSGIATDRNVTAYAARDGRRRLLAVINKGPDAVALSVDWDDIAGRNPDGTLYLNAPSLDSRKVSLTAGAPRLPATVPGYTAMLLSWELRA